MKMITGLFKWIIKSIKLLRNMKVVSKTPQLSVKATYLTVFGTLKFKTRVKYKDLKTKLKTIYEISSTKIDSLTFEVT